jgi:FtsP/CotA-like multicopper oxidase with cupredoxin domain
MKTSLFSKVLFATNPNLLVTLIVTLSFSFVQGQCPTNNLVENPEEFIWTPHPVSPNNPEEYYSGVMEVGEATFTINGETLTTRAYRQQGGAYSIPGPTIKVVPGNKYILRFHNTLPYEPLSSEHNVFKDPNVSNMHTHGLHISGESPGDDVTRSFEGGRGGDFVYDIPLNHMGGTYWYHAHHHGSTFLQVSGGLFGLLIVEDGADGIPDPVANMNEREIIFGFLDPAAAGTGGDTLMSGTLSPTWTVNGLVQGNVCVPPNTWEHWRVLIADRASNMKTIEFGPGIEVMLLARDGVWRTIAPKELSTNQLQMTGASRADFAIRANSDSWVAIDGQIVANIFTEGSADVSVHPFDEDGSSTWSAIRPEYLRDLRDEVNVNFESVSMGARTINGSKYVHDVPTFSLLADQVQEWSLSGAVQHPFHLHVYHLQALEDKTDFEAGEYYDVVAAKMSVRFDLNQNSSLVYDGRTILHCHILGHEDRGAMGWLDVDGGQGPPTFPLDGDLAEPYSEYYLLNGTQQPPTPPTNLIATETSSTTIELTWQDNSFDEDGFEIERSLDGVNFSFVNAVGTNINAYSDNGLSPSTTYFYRVSAYNSTGNSDYTNVANATTQSSGGGVVMHVENITVERVALTGNRFRADATITIFDDLGNTVSGATVEGNFTGASSSSESGITNTNGQVTLSSRAIKNPSGEWCFAVTNLSLAGATYDPGANVLTEACESGPVQSPINNGLNINDIHLGVYPNPFQDHTRIMFQLPDQMHVTFEVYSVLGHRIALISDKSYMGGQYAIDWNAEDLDVGLYFLKMSVNGILIDTQRLIIYR